MRTKTLLQLMSQCDMSYTKLDHAIRMGWVVYLGTDRYAVPRGL